jgi:hypothetical protein
VHTLERSSSPPCSMSVDEGGCGADDDEDDDDGADMMTFLDNVWQG